MIKPRQQEHEAADHTSPTVREQKETDDGASSFSHAVQDIRSPQCCNLESPSQTCPKAGFPSGFRS